MDPKLQVYVKVNAYLNANQTRIMVFSVDMAMIDVHTFVPESKQLTDDELRSQIVGFRLMMYPRMGKLSSPPSIADSQLIQTAKNGFTSVIKGVGFERKDGKITISPSGLTAELKKGTSAASINISWGGTLNLEASKGPIHISGSLSSDKWEVSLSIPDDPSVPDMSKLGKIFSEAEKAMRGIIGASAGIDNLKDIQKVAGKMKPFMDPVKDAVEAAQGIAKAPSSGVSFGFKIGSPDPLPGSSGMPGGVQVSATLTWFF